MKAILFAAMAVAIQAQTPAKDLEKSPAFEVASIKPAEPGARGMGVQRQAGGRVNMKNVTLRLLITMAWDIRDHQLIGAPGWFDNEHFDIVAKPETEIPKTPEGNGKLMLMVQALVVERFGLVFHRETKDLPIYALVVAKNGPKLAASEPGTQNSMMMGRGKLEGKNMNLSALAKILTNPLGRTVVDRTGLTGDYNFTVEWTPDVNEAIVPKGAPKGMPAEAPKDTILPPDGPSLFTALQEQLGLKLESRKGPVEMFVIDRAERPSAN
jgi:bla regulator protein BlaR1